MLRSKFVNVDVFSDFYALVRQVPDGKITTYGALARALGDVKAARACGYMLSVNPDPDGTPCYKVVHSDGRVGNYTHPLGNTEKVRRLRTNGIEIRNDRICQFESVFFDDFVTNSILEKLRAEQLSFAGELTNNDEIRPSRVSAFDVSYAGEVGYGSMVTVSSGGAPETEISTREVRIPYISSYLSYREFPVLSSLVANSGDFLVFDGNGILHERNMGLASFAGIISGKPSMGVAKSLTAGKIVGNRIYLKGVEAGFVNSGKYYVSPGNLISLQSARILMKERGEEIISLLKSAHRSANEARLLKSVKDTHANN
ncbi:MAG: endonuclease V [Thermoplasmataceae archaeon]